MKHNTQEEIWYWLIIFMLGACIFGGGFWIGRRTAPDWVSAERDRAFFDKGYAAAQSQGKTATTTVLSEKQKCDVAGGFSRLTVRENPLEQFFSSETGEKNRVFLPPRIVGA
jgi:hypothetical protein